MTTPQETKKLLADHGFRELNDGAYSRTVEYEVTSEMIRACDPHILKMVEKYGFPCWNKACGLCGSKEFKTL